MSTERRARKGPSGTATSTPPSEAAKGSLNPPLQIGRVLKAHGLRGEVHFQLHWPDSESLFQASELLLELPEGLQPFPIEAVRRGGKTLLLKLGGVDNRDQAEALQGVSAWVPRETLPALEEGEHYLVDLIGATVMAPDGVVGTVENIGLYPSIETLVIRMSDGTLCEQPLGDRWIQRIDALARIVELSTRDGLV